MVSDEGQLWCHVTTSRIRAVAHNMPRARREKNVTRNIRVKEGVYAAHRILVSGFVSWHDLSMFVDVCRCSTITAVPLRDDAGTAEL